MTRPLYVALLALAIVGASCGTDRTRDRSGIPTSPDPGSRLRGSQGLTTMYEDPGGGGDPGALFVAAPLPGEVLVRVPLSSDYDPFTDVAVVSLSSTPMYKFTYRYWCLDSSGAGVRSSGALVAMEQAGLVVDSTPLHDFGLQSYAYANAPAAYGADSTGAPPKPGDPPPPAPPPTSEPQVDGIPKVRTSTWGEIKARFRR